jgi:hypothetical protein
VSQSHLKNEWTDRYCGEFCEFGSIWDIHSSSLCECKNVANRERLEAPESRNIISLPRGRFEVFEKRIESGQEEFWQLFNHGGGGKISLKSTVEWTRERSQLSCLRQNYLRLSSVSTDNGCEVGTSESVFSRDLTAGFRNVSDTYLTVNVTTAYVSIENYSHLWMISVDDACDE